MAGTDGDRRCDTNGAAVPGPANGLRVSGKPRCPARRDGHPARSLRTRPRKTFAYQGVTQAGLLQGP
jgi:hypothetical protein